MLHHVSFPVANLPAAKALYAAALGALGYRLVADLADFAGFGVQDGEDIFALKQQPKAQAAGPGFHLAFAAASRQAVDQFHANALAHGGRDNGAPGLRPHYGPSYYAGFIIDLDGHHIEAVHTGSPAHV
jgi:catechol 2,3-dioxygenase-like lactoylglutathione lyase family enzyme